MAKKPVAILGAAGHGKTTLLEALAQHAAGEQFVEITSAPADLPFYMDLKELRTKAHKTAISTIKSELSDTDVGILVVDVVTGPENGTRLHVELARIAGLRLVAIALTKTDLEKDKELQDLVEVEVRELLNELELAGDDAEVVRLAATAAKPKLLKILAAVGRERVRPDGPGRRPEALPRQPPDRVHAPGSRAPNRACWRAHVVGIKPWERVGARHCESVVWTHFHGAGAGVRTGLAG